VDWTRGQAVNGDRQVASSAGFPPNWASFSLRLFRGKNLACLGLRVFWGLVLIQSILEAISVSCARQALGTLVLSQFLLPFDVLLRFTSEICESGNGNLSLNHTATTATLIPMHNVFTTVFLLFHQ